MESVNQRDISRWCERLWCEPFPPVQPVTSVGGTVQIKQLIVKDVQDYSLDAYYVLSFAYIWGHM